MTIQILSSEEGDLTLHLPRILCLHGGGTNARIFRMQCRGLERALKSKFRLVYAEAPFVAQPGSDVTSVYRKHGPFKAWLRITSADPERTDQEIIENINLAITKAIFNDNLQGATGDWAGLLGFSQGAKVAASILYAQQTLSHYFCEDVSVWPLFRFGVLMAGRGPLVWMLPNMSNCSTSSIPAGLVRASCPSILTNQPKPAECRQHVLQIPTVHIHGLRDPGLSLHRQLYDAHFQQRSASVLEWEGDHRLPIKSKDVEAVVDQICLLAREVGILDTWC